MSVAGGQQLFVMDDNNESATPSQQDASRRRRRFSVHSLHDFDSIVQDFIVSLAGGAGQPMYIMGNPGDYVYSRDSLDTIVTQLLNQMDGTGPPPLTKDKIAEIPKVAVTEEQANSKLQCSICWEDFQLTETVRRLPCVVSTTVLTQCSDISFNGFLFHLFSTFTMKTVSFLGWSYTVRVQCVVRR